MIKTDFPSGISLQQFLFPCVHIISGRVFSFLNKEYFQI